MKAFTYQHWHAWQGVGGILLSDERIKQLREFATVDDVINWLYLHGEKPAARALNEGHHEQDDMT